MQPSLLVRIAGSKDSARKRGDHALIAPMADLDAVGGQAVQTRLLFGLGDHTSGWVEHDFIRSRYRLNIQDLFAARSKGLLIRHARPAFESP